MALETRKTLGATALGAGALWSGLLGAFMFTATVLGPVGSAQAQGVFTQPIYARIYSITPRCRANPDYPVVGRVAGYVSGGRGARLSWVGCFPNFAECNAWRRIARGEVTPPINHNTCEERF
ncbi:MAG: hypothetical protein AAGJ94_01080 [Pseudomonadota bacterium]